MFSLTASSINLEASVVGDRSTSGRVIPTARRSEALLGNWSSGLLRPLVQLTKDLPATRGHVCQDDEQA